MKTRVFVLLTILFVFTVAGFGQETEEKHWAYQWGEELAKAEADPLLVLSMVANIRTVEKPLLSDDNGAYPNLAVDTGAQLWSGYANTHLGKLQITGDEDTFHGWFLEYYHPTQEGRNINDEVLHDISQMWRVTTLQDANLTGLDLSTISQWDHLDLSGAIFDNAVVSSKFMGCILDNTSWVDTLCYNTVFLGEIIDIEFPMRNAVIAWKNGRSASTIVFRNMDLRNSDFSQITMNNPYGTAANAYHFANCNLQNTGITPEIYALSVLTDCEGVDYQAYKGGMELQEESNTFTNKLSSPPVNEARILTAKYINGALYINLQPLQKSIGFTEDSVTNFVGFDVDVNGDRLGRAAFTDSYFIWSAESSTHHRLEIEEKYQGGPPEDVMDLDFKVYGALSNPLRLHGPYTVIIE